MQTVLQWGIEAAQYLGSRIGPSDAALGLVPSPLCCGIPFILGDSLHRVCFFLVQDLPQDTLLLASCLSSFSELKLLGASCWSQSQSQDVLTSNKVWA